MPTIKRQTPLHPEGEYCGQARRVTQEWSKPKPRPDGTTPEPVQIFRVPLWTHIGKPVTAFLRVLESTAWMWEAACKSGEIIPPEGDEFKISPDDFENRVFYFGVKHTEYNGITRAEVRFHTRAYALEVNPALAQVSFPNEAVRPLYLSAATPNVPTMSKPTWEHRTNRVPEDSSIPLSPELSIGELEENMTVPEGITEGEFREALAYAKQRTEEKRNPKGKAA